MTLGRRLEVKDPKLQDIHQAHEQLREKGYQMLIRWKQEKGSAATYQVLSDALQHYLVRRQDLAKQFCYIHGNYSLNLAPCLNVAKCWPHVHGPYVLTIQLLFNKRRIRSHDLYNAT